MVYKMVTRNCHTNCLYLFTHVLFSIHKTKHHHVSEVIYNLYTKLHAGLFTEDARTYYYYNYIICMDAKNENSKVCFI